jgi:outer membrane protein assembly factor BamB
VWSSTERSLQALAVAGGVLVVGGDRRVELAPLGPDGPDPWAVTLDNQRILALALTHDGDIVAAGEDILDPYTTRLHRFAPTGTLLWSHAVPELFSPHQVAVTPGDEIVLVTGYSPVGSAVAVFDAAGAPRWTRLTEAIDPVRHLFGGVALGADGRIHAVSHRSDFSDPAFGLLRLEALTPQGELIWQVDHALAGRIESSAVALTRAGTLFVVGDEFLGADSNAAVLAEFDAAGSLLWSRRDTSMFPESGLSVGRLVPAPGGGAIAEWWFAGDHDAWCRTTRYDAVGEVVYALDAGYLYVFDLALGSDDLLYILEGRNDEPTNHFQVVPYVP